MESPRGSSIGVLPCDERAKNQSNSVERSLGAFANAACFPDTIDQGHKAPVLRRGDVLSRVLRVVLMPQPRRVLFASRDDAGKVSTSPNLELKLG